MSDRISKFVKANVEMTLLLLQFVTFLVEKPNVVVNARQTGMSKPKSVRDSKLQKTRGIQVKIVPGSNMIVATLLPSKSSVDRVERLMYMH